MTPLSGIHHVTAIAGDPQRNADFYVGVLGLRLVKRSVNQDDPGTYHLFYADALGHPGTDLTFFPWRDAPRGWQGNGQAVTVGLAIPQGALGFWAARLAQAGREARKEQGPSGEDVIAFSDPDGLRLELVAGPGTDERALWAPWEDGPVPVEMAIRGFHNVAVQEAGVEPTVGFLTEVLGFRLVHEAGERLRFATGEGDSGAMLDLLPRPGERPGRVAVGAVHHVAWRTPDDAEQRAWWERIGKVNATLSPIIDRFWFRSIYFREPGGVLFEIATDGPGFTADEAAEELGSRLILPPWLEPQRSRIEAKLPPLRLPAAVSTAKGARRE
ncbi:MAG: ring-cleaving dioxygenase [Armatimonadota bacterium]